MEEKLIYLSIIILIIAAEYFIKKYISKREFKIKSKKVFIMPTLNTGFLYSLLKGKNSFAKILCTIILVLCITLFFIFTPSFMCSIGLSFILGGGASNTLDRFFRGGVLDYIAVKGKKITIYNLGDFCIFSGCAIVTVSCVI